MGLSKGYLLGPLQVIPSCVFIINFKNTWKNIQEITWSSYFYLWTGICLLGYRQHFHFKFQLNKCWFWNFHSIACSCFRIYCIKNNNMIDLLGWCESFGEIGCLWSNGGLLLFDVVSSFVDDLLLVFILSIVDRAEL